MENKRLPGKRDLDCYVRRDESNSRLQTLKDQPALIKKTAWGRGKEPILRLMGKAEVADRLPAQKEYGRSLRKREEPIRVPRYSRKKIALPSCGAYFQEPEGKRVSFLRKKELRGGNGFYSILGEGGGTHI